MRRGFGVFGHAVHYNEHDDHSAVHYNDHDDHSAVHYNDHDDRSAVHYNDHDVAANHSEPDRLCK